MIKLGLGNFLLISALAVIGVAIFASLASWLAGRNIPFISPAADGGLHIFRQAVAA